MDIGAENYCRFLNGHNDALIELIKLYKDSLILFIDSTVHNVFIAEDLMEETFVRLATKRPCFSGHSSFKTFLFSIARNLAIDWMRKESKNNHIPLDSIQNELATTSLEQSYFRKDRQLRVRNAVKRLPPNYAEIIHLVYFEGLSNSDVAQIMKKNKRQIENMLYRAKSSLKAELIKEGFHNEEP